MEAAKQKLIRQVSTYYQNFHPWIEGINAYNLYRSRPVFMVPSHIQVKTLAKILLKQGVVLSASAITDDDISELTVEAVYAKFASDLGRSERANNILDLEFEGDQLMAGAEEQIPTKENLASFV
jgi:hypothetical protein